MRRLVPKGWWLWAFWALILLSAVTSGWFVHTKWGSRTPTREVDGKPPLSFAAYIDITVPLLEHVLDYGFSRWSAAKQKLVLRGDTARAISADQMPEIAEAEVASFGNRHSLVRSLPYPFFRCLSIPGQSLSSPFSDLFYLHSLLARKYGIDANSSVVPFTAEDANKVEQAIFDRHTEEPRILPVAVENEVIDQWPLFLTFYYRGWLDLAPAGAAGTGTSDFMRKYNVFPRMKNPKATAWEREYTFPKPAEAFSQSPPYVEESLQLLANCKYNLDGKRRFSDRVWIASATVQQRFLETRLNLSKHTTCVDNTVRIEPWKDPLTGVRFPEGGHVAEDLHGQTIYVPDAQHARVFVDRQELKTLLRNPKDFTGRESVTIVSTAYPTSIFDEVDFYERNGRVVQDKASCFFVTHEAYSGKHSLEVRLEEAGSGSIAWEPMGLHSYETDYLRFAYKKTNPKAKVWIELTTMDGKRFIATEGDRRGLQGWNLSPWSGSDFREVIVDFSQMEMPADGVKLIPRQRFRAVRFGLDSGKVGDAVYFDRVEFLGVRSCRPNVATGVAIGGQLKPALDGEMVAMKIGRESRQTVTERGGWFIFRDVPVDAVFELYHERDGVRYPPWRGRVLQAVKNDLEYHIDTSDVRSPGWPRPKNLIGTSIPPNSASRSTDSQEARDLYESYFAPHSIHFYAGAPKGKWCYLADDSTNNFGYIDRDRRFENRERALRIVLHGECWTEGLQTYTGQHMNMVLESILRRETGMPVEVIVTATSSSSPASYALNFQKYGTKFRPDLTLVFLNSSSILHLEPTLQEKLVGWKKEHSPYQMYDLDEHGQLLSYPPDSSFGAFAVPADPKPLVGAVPLAQTFMVNETQHPMVTRSFLLLKAIIKEQFLEPMRSYHGDFGIIYGYDFPLPEYGKSYGPYTVSAERWTNSIKSLCAEMKVIGLDLSADLRRARFPSPMLWETDDHLTPTGHYKIAEALAKEILGNPEFQQRLKARRGLNAEPMSRRKSD